MILHGHTIFTGIIKHLEACNSLLERENKKLKAYTDRASENPKISDSVIIKNATNFNSIINSKLSEPSLFNFQNGKSDFLFYFILFCYKSQIGRFSFDFIC
jgi:hypothetical protein